MYEIIIAILIIVIFVIIIEMQKHINWLRDSYSEFLDQHVVYVKAVGDHSEAVQATLEDLDKRMDMNYYAEQSLYAHVVYLEKQLEELKGECNALPR